KNPKNTVENPQINFRYHEARKEINIAGTYYPLREWVKTPYGEMMFSENPAQNGLPAGPLFFAIVNPQRVTSVLLEKLTIEPSGKLSTVINLNLEDPVPQRGEDILNNLIYAYNEVGIADRNQLAANTMAFIEDRIQIVQNELEAVEGQVEDFKATAGVVNLDVQGKLYLENVGDTDRKLADINMKLAVLK